MCLKNILLPRNDYEHVLNHHEAFLLILVNVYDIMGALADNWTIYWFSIASRISAAILFWSFGAQWRDLLGVEVVILAILAGAMWMGR